VGVYENPLHVRPRKILADISTISPTLLGVNVPLLQIAEGAK